MCYQEIICYFQAMTYHVKKLVTKRTNIYKGIKTSMSLYTNTNSKLFQDLQNISISQATLVLSSVGSGQHLFTLRCDALLRSKGAKKKAVPFTFMFIDLANLRTWKRGNEIVLFLLRTIYPH